MPIGAVTRLGPYEITGPLGAGGMGEVYRARDTRLGREVALKTLPASLVADPEQRARFEREARAASSLNHPHICVIHDVGSQDGVDFLVMELLDGETAAERLTRGPIPVGEVMRIGAQIADALDRAHKKGLVHRDLKPANIMLVPGTSKSAPVQAKLLDFGLARPTSAAAHGETMTRGPFGGAQGGLTAAGTIVGTFHYMSPKQVEGREVDARTDIWSLGATLYEMATGARAFDGASTASLISAVLRDEPRPMAERVPLTPAAFQRLVSQCLAKDPDDRWQSAGDVKRELEWIAGGSGSGSSAAAPAVAAAPARRSRWMARTAIAAAVLVTAAAAGWVGRRSNARETAWSEFTQLTDASGVETGPSLSPDGSSFAYSSAARGSWDIYVQRVGGRNPVLVAGDPARDELWPAFSPDGTQIAFSQGGTGGIFVVGATGESVRRVTDLGSNPAWSPDGRRLAFCTEEVRTAYNTFSNSTLWTVDVNGGAPVKLDAGVDTFQPAWSPSGRRIAFWANINGQRDLATIAAAGGARVMVTSDTAVDWAPIWSPDGRFLYFASDRGGSMGIWRIAVDEASGRATAPPELIAAGVDVAMDLPHLSADGTWLVFRSKTQSVNPAAIDFDPATERAGSIRLLQQRTGLLMPADVSPDGRWIALNNLFERQQDLFIMRSDGMGLSRLTDDLARDWSPKFMPDGTALSFFSNKAGTYDAWSIRLDGSNRTRLTAIPDGVVAYTMFAPDGERLLAATISGDILIGSAPWPFTRQTATTIKPQRVGGGTLLPSAWSRDGRWLAGPIVLPSGVQRGNALYDVKAGTVRQLSDDAGSVDNMAWTADHGRVIYFTINGKLVIQNVTSLERREIAVALPLPPDDLWSITASPDGRTLYYGAQQVEANIWKVVRPKETR